MLINVGIVEDHPVVTQGILHIFKNQKDINILYCWTNGADLFASLKNGSIPDVLLLDILLPLQNGDSITRILQREYPQIKILSMSVLESAVSANTMLRLGAKGYILKSATPEQWIDAVIKVYNDQEYIEPQLRENIEHLVVAEDRTKQASISTTLTPREKEVLQEIVNGLSKKEIAKKLGLSINTVKQYQYNLSLKLEVHSAPALVRHALMTGLAQ